jgi:hypothetical protein
MPFWGKWHQRCAGTGKQKRMNTKEELQQGQQGSGSAENTGRQRQEQTANTTLSEHDKQTIADQIGENKESVVGLKDLGAVSGRDDASGGSGDRMEDQSTGGATIR